MISETKEDTAYRLFEEGKDAESVSSLIPMNLDYSKRLYRKWKRRNGTYQRRSSMKEIAYKLISEGKTVEEIMAITGRTKSTVHGYFFSYDPEGAKTTANPQRFAKRTSEKKYWSGCCVFTKDSRNFWR